MMGLHQKILPVHSLSCIFLQIPKIEKLEKSLHDVLKRRADLLIERRRQDVRDEAEECSMGTGVKGQEGGEQARQLRAVEREGRRRRRREKRGIGGPTHYEGQSSDDELLKTNSDKFSAEIGTTAEILVVFYCSPSMTD